MVCPNCGAEAPGEVCPNCGEKTPPAAPALTPRIETDVTLRAGAYLIDLAPAVLAGLFIGRIPVVGAILLGIVLLDYWLLRDITGGSLGKIVVGLRVVSRDGSSSDVKARILRNVTLALGPALLILPVLSYKIIGAVTVTLVLMEILFLVVKKERLGDLMAGTTVVKKVAEKSEDSA